MKTSKYIFFILLASLTSCSDIIDLQSQSNVTTATFYSNTSEINSALTGCYNGLQRTMTEEWSLTELRSDNSFMREFNSTTTANNDYSSLDMFFPSTSYTGFYNYWLATYNNIRNANTLLDAIGANYNNSGAITYAGNTIEGADSDIKRAAAQASFIRAYHYFNLVRLYGDVFLVHEPLSPENSKKINRSPKAEIYKLIEADLLNAITYGDPAKYSSILAVNQGRANSWSAKALLAKVYLTLNRKSEAIVLLQDVIANSGYGLQSTYANVFSITNEANSEILFAVRYKGGGVGLGNPLPNLFAPLNSGNAVITGGGKGFNTPTYDIEAAYETGDARKAVNIATYGSGTNARLYVRKYIATTAIINDSENDMPVLRFSDVLLMLAEAQGNIDDSRIQINKVRVRAGLPSLTTSDVDTTAKFELALAKERRLELAFENQRWFDLLRFGTTLTTINAETIMKNHFEAMYPVHYGLYPNPKLSLADIQANTNSDRFLLPIPQREIDNNTFIVIPQNPSY